MSFYRKLISTVFAMSLATCVFADDAANSTTTTTSTDSSSAATAANTVADSSNGTTANTAADTSNATAANTVAENTSSNAMPAQAAEQTASADKVDLNKATAKELMKVKGISAARAKAIVTYRKKHGDFKSVDELKEVKGFKKVNEKAMQQIEDQFTVG